MRKAHGQRNLKLCLQLLDKGDYLDWVVTTAFYSSVHFVEHALFPLAKKAGLGTHVNFNDYYQSLPFSTSKHAAKVDLVRTYIRPVSTAYRELLDDCNNARYIDYNVNPSDAIEAKKKAETIKAACLTLKP